MPLEMPRVAPRHSRHNRHHHHNGARAAAWPDVEENARRDRGSDDDDDDSSGYSDDEQTQRLEDDYGGTEAEDEDNGYDSTTCGDMCCAPLLAMTKPVEVGELGSYGYAGEAAFWIWPLFGPLLFENTSSDVRDGLANERSK
ncbi:hypothetical protein Sste5344_002048 [Sporothrix stenoceras]